jgi:hypothetical protein
LRRLFSVCVGLALVSQTTSAQTPSAVSTADRHHPFVEHAERRYRQYLASESQGDTAAYKEVRTRQAYETTMEQLKKLGKMESDLGLMLKRVASMQSDVSRLTFVRCDAFHPAFSAGANQPIEPTGLAPHEKVKERDS